MLKHTNWMLQSAFGMLKLTDFGWPGSVKATDPPYAYAWQANVALSLVPYQ
jgi:hypothetical protein